MFAVMASQTPEMTAKMSVKPHVTRISTCERSESNIDDTVLYFDEVHSKEPPAPIAPPSDPPANDDNAGDNEEDDSER